MSQSDPEGTILGSLRGPSLGPLGSLMGALGLCLYRKAVFVQEVEAMLEPLGAILGAPGATWNNFWTIWENFGITWGIVGAILSPFWGEDYAKTR